MPLGMTADMQNDMSLVENQKNFSYFYYDLWPSLFCTLICQLLTPLFRWINYGEELDLSVVSITIMVMVQLTLGYLIIQMIFTQLGFNFLGAEIERSSNKLVLNNLEEGVIIIE